MAPLGGATRMTTSDAVSPSAGMMTFEGPSSDNHERIDETMHGSLIKTVDAQAAPVLTSVPTVKSKCGCRGRVPATCKRAITFRNALEPNVSHTKR